MLLMVLSTIVFFSCKKLNEHNADVDGRIHTITEDVSDIDNDFAIGHGEIRLEGTNLPLDFYIVSQGLIYGTDSSSLKIKSHSCNFDHVNTYYGCYQYYTYIPISSNATVLNIGIYYDRNGSVLDIRELCFGGIFACPLMDLKLGTRYYIRAFAHVSNDWGDKNKNSSETFNKYLYGSIKEFISGGITQDPTVFVPFESLKIGVMKEDLSSTVFSGLYAEMYCSSLIFNKWEGLGGYTDWRVPTLNELKEIYKVQNQIGGFKSAIYWSSDIHSEDIYYYYWNFANNTSGNASLHNWPDGYVRLVRNLP